jgi:multiple sugar transport system substrate-binding protein
MPMREPVTISFVHPEDSTGTYEAWATAFQEENPRVTIELKEMGSIPRSQLAQEDTYLISQLEMGQYMENGMILNLSPFVEQDEDFQASALYPSAVRVFSAQGKQWALPSGIQLIMMYYNKDLFDRYGVPYPEAGWDWGGFLDRALDLTDPNADVYGYAVHYNSDFAIYEPAILIYQFGGRLFDNLANPSRVTFNEPANIEAMQFYASLMHDHHVSPTPEEIRQMGNPYPWRGILEEKFAMWMTMYSDRGGQTWPMEWEMDWGIVPIPQGEVAATLAMADGLFVSAETEHPDVCWEWLKFASRQAPPFALPASQAMVESAEYEAQVGPDVAAAARRSMENAILINPNIVGFDAAVNAMVGAFTSIQSGEVDPAEALSEAQREAGF